MTDVIWIAMISAFVVGAFLGAIAMAMSNDIRRDDRAYRRGIDECPRVHKWGEDTG